MERGHEFLDTVDTITTDVIGKEMIDNKIDTIQDLTKSSSQSTLAFEEEEYIDYPEGGLKAYTVIFGCFMGFVACFGLLNTMGAIETYVQHHQLAAAPTSTIGWVFSIFVFTNFFTCIFSGTYFDRNGSRLPLIVGTIMHVGGLLATASSTKVYHFILAFSICTGTGNGILMSPLISVPSHYFNKKRGNATALATMGGSIGGIVFPLMLRSLFEKLGFEWSIRIFAFINLGCLCIAVVLARERLPHQHDDQTIFYTYFLNSFDVKAFKELPYLFCVVGNFFADISISAALTYFGSYVLSVGFTQNNAYLLITITNVCGIFGRWVPGYMSDHLGRFNTAIVMLTCLAIVTLVVWLPFGHKLSNLYGFAVLFGFFSGSIFSTLPVCCGQISKTEEFGKRYSTMYAVIAFGVLINGPICGALINSSYDYLIIWSGLTSLVSAVCYLISRYTVVGFKICNF